MISITTLIMIYSSNIEIKQRKIESLCAFGICFDTLSRRELHPLQSQREGSVWAGFYPLLEGITNKNKLPVI
ncbi:unnamed protein product [Musa acuminata subsp. malaccensis]|uniref:(wild Malaysian banana) hypothetical protein n=1 Tax=Musa acuminata subsp. malaccensis TaxID=214687 RepID=A0A804HXA9_MUSAM|nr:unnamed protein product [Musa acuminata subsp. malaccensis]